MPLLCNICCIFLVTTGIIGFKDDHQEAFLGFLMYTRHLKICVKFMTSLCIDVTWCHVVVLFLVMVVRGLVLYRVSDLIFLVSRQMC